MEENYRENFEREINFLRLLIRNQKFIQFNEQLVQVIQSKDTKQFAILKEKMSHDEIPLTDQTKLILDEYLSSLPTQNKK